MASKRWKMANLLLITVLTVPLLSGCWDRLEIEDRANVLAVSIDVAGKSEEQQEPEVSHEKGKFPVPGKSMVRITAQIAVPGRIPLGPSGTGSSGGEQKPVWVVSVVGHTLDDAMTNLQQQLGDRVFLSHLRVIILSEAFAKRGVEEVNEYLRRDPEVRRTAWMLVAKGDASKFMKAAPELERVPALYLMATLDHAVAMGKFPNDFLGIFWSQTASLGQEPFLPYVTLRAKGTVNIAGMAYFRENKLVGVTKPFEIGEYLAVKGLNPGGYLAAVKVPGTSNSVMVHTLHRKSKVKVDMQQDHPHATIKIFYEAELEEKSSPQMKVDKLDTIRKIEQSAAQDDEKAILKFIKATQQRGADIFGFGEYVRAKHANYWDTHIQNEQKWGELYKTMTVDVTVSPRIRRVGMMAR